MNVSQVKEVIKRAKSTSSIHELWQLQQDVNLKFSNGDQKVLKLIIINIHARRLILLCKINVYKLTYGLTAQLRWASSNLTNSCQFQLYCTIFIGLPSVLSLYLLSSDTLSKCSLAIKRLVTDLSNQLFTYGPNFNSFSYAASQLVLIQRGLPPIYNDFYQKKLHAKYAIQKALKNQASEFWRQQDSSKANLIRKGFENLLNENDEGVWLTVIYHSLIINVMKAYSLPKPKLSEIDTISHSFNQQHSLSKSTLQQTPNRQQFSQNPIKSKQISNQKSTNSIKTFKKQQKQVQTSYQLRVTKYNYKSNSKSNKILKITPNKLFWFDSIDSFSSASQHKIKHISTVLYGKISEKLKYAEAKPSQCFSLVTEDRTIDFVADTSDAAFKAVCMINTFLTHKSQSIGALLWKRAILQAKSEYSAMLGFQKVRSITKILGFKQF